MPHSPYPAFQPVPLEAVSVPYVTMPLHTWFFDLLLLSKIFILVGLGTVPYTFVYRLFDSHVFFTQVPNGCGIPNMYMQGFKCIVTNARSTTPVAPAVPPVWCEDDQSKCVKGAKQVSALMIHP